MDAQLKGIIFDLDGTLTDNHLVCLDAYAETAARLGGRRPSADEVYALFGPSEEGILETLLPGRLSESLPMFLSVYETLHAAAPGPFAGVEALLEGMRARGLRAAIVTGKGAGSAEISLRILGLDRWIDCVETGFADRADKPYSIGKVLARWQIEPGEAAYVGDQPYDMRAAREAGLRAWGAGWAETAGVRREECGADHIFWSVDELSEWLREACPADRPNPSKSKLSGV